MEIILGPHNGVQIKGKRPRRPKTRKQNVLKNSGTIAPLPTMVNLQRGLSGQEAAMTAATAAATTALNSSMISSRSLRNTLNLLSGIEHSHWQIKQLPDNSYSITMDSIQSLTHFFHLLHELAVSSTLSTSSLSHSYNTNNAARTVSPDNHALARRMPVHLPLYIEYHSELYAKRPCDGRGAVDFPVYYTTLSNIIEDSMHYFAECMNHYYPVRPRSMLRSWIDGLERPSEDPLALAIGTYWCRHLLIHHRPASLVVADDDGQLIDIIQQKLALMTHDALGEHFDEPSVDIIFALCLCNMTTVFGRGQKATFHMMAVRLAAVLGIKPKRIDDDSDEAELDNRLWWYLYQIDHFLHESGTIQVSMLEPHSDDHDALLRLVRPTPCSFDDPNEVAGVLEWGHVLELWIIRRRIVKEIEIVLDRGGDLDEGMYRKVQGIIDDWTGRIPAGIRAQPGRVDNYHDIALLGTCATVRMERCTNLSLLLQYFRPHQDIDIFTPFERQTIFEMIECSTEMLRLRRTVVEFSPCQTWPGDLKRSIEILIDCSRYKDTQIKERAKTGLRHARSLLQETNEVKWKDPICVVLIQDIKNVLLEDPTDSTHHPFVLDMPVVKEEVTVRSRSIKMADHMYPGVMMFDRELQPRANYYRPINTSESLEHITVFENISRYMTS